MFFFFLKLEASQKLLSKLPRLAAFSLHSKLIHVFAIFGGIIYYRATLSELLL